MINKSIESNRNLISSQISKAILMKQQRKEDFELIKRKISQKYPFKKQINLQKSSNAFNERNSTDCLESIHKFQTTSKIKSPNVVISNRNHFISSRRSKKLQQSVSQESIFNQQVKKSINEQGYRVIIKNNNRISTTQIEEQVTQQFQKPNSCKDPETFTDWVEKLYGKQWFC